MPDTRRLAMMKMLTLSGLVAQENQRENPAKKPDEEEDVRLPNGKLQKDAISKKNHEDALKDVETLIQMAEELRDDLKRSGEYVVSVASLKKTEVIEKLARRIRGKLKA